MTFKEMSIPGRKINAPVKAVPIPTEHHMATAGRKKSISIIKTRINPP